MKHDGFRYDFTGKELLYFLFGKKICPKCPGKLVKSKGYETVEGSVFNSKTADFFFLVQKSNIIHIFIIAITVVLNSH